MILDCFSLNFSFKRTIIDFKSEVSIMNKVERLEDYTNAVIAIVITLMVLDVHAPTGHFFSNIFHANNHLLTYIYSFLLISMYWVNHGRLFSNSKHLKINSQILWANNIFLLFITFLPFASSWLARNINQRDPEMFYAAIMLCIDLSYYFLMRTLIHYNHSLNKIPRFKVYHFKLHLNLVINILAIFCGYFIPVSTIAISLLAIVIWMIPDHVLQ